MKTLFASYVLGVALTCTVIAQTPAKGTARTKVAVVEFTPGAKAAGISAEARRQLQASIAFLLTKSNRFDVVDVRHTREASKSNLAAVNGDATTEAVKVGKLLKVSYVLTGNIIEYNTNGSATVETRLIEVATGNVKHEKEIPQKSSSEMTTGGDVEMKTKVLKPLIEQLIALLTALSL